MKVPDDGLNQFAVTVVSQKSPKSNVYGSLPLAFLYQLTPLWRLYQSFGWLSLFFLFAVEPVKIGKSIDILLHAKETITLHDLNNN